MENPVIGYMYKYEDIFARFNFSYASGKVIHDTATGKLYKLNVAYTANTVTSDAAFTTWLNNTTNATPTYSTGGTSDYNAGTAYSANDTIKDPATGDIYKCIVAAPAGTPLSNTTNFQKITQGNQAYNATTNIPVVAGIPNGTELFVETAGTQTIGGVSYYLNKGDLIKKSNAGTYSVIRSDDGNSSTVNTGSVITLNNTYTETQANNQNITLFDCTLAVNAPSKLVKYTIKVAHDNVTVSVTGGGNVSYVPSRTFNKGDWVILINNNIEWFVGS